MQPINTDLIPNWKTLDPRLQRRRLAHGRRQHYGVPYQWGPNVLMYNTNVFKTPPTSWTVVFEAQNLPDGKPNKGRVQAYDGPIYIADAALYLKTTKPELGINDPVRARPKTQYNAALDLLRAQQPSDPPLLARRHRADEDFKNEGVVAVQLLAVIRSTALTADKQPIASTIPKEGATGWADTTMLHAEAKHPNCAYKWMELVAAAEGPGRRRRLVRLDAGGARGLQGQRTAGRRGLQDQWLRELRQDRLLEDAGAECGSAASCVPYSDWARTTSRSWAAVMPERGSDLLDRAGAPRPASRGRSAIAVGSELRLRWHRSFELAGAPTMTLAVQFTTSPGSSAR